MNRFLLPDNEPNAHVRLSTTRQDSLLTQQWAVDFSDCACSSSYERRETQIQIEFVNREYELKLIKSLTHPIKIIDAPAGFGKTWLLLRTLQDLSDEGWQCAYIRFSPNNSLNDTDIRTSIVRQIVKEADEIKIESDFEMLEQLSKKSANLAFFFDSIECGDSHIDWLLNELIPNCERDIRGVKKMFVFAGRYLRSEDDKSVKWIRKGREFIELSEFSQSVIKQVLENIAKERQVLSSYSSNDFDDWSRQILRLSGGHPRSIQKLIEELVRRPRWFLSTTPGGEKQYFNRFIQQEINKVLYVSESEEELKRALSKLLIFRIFYTDHFIFLQEKEEITPKLDARETLTLLARKGLIVKGRPFYSDNIARNLVLTELRICNQDKYRSLNELAYKFYIGKIEETFFNNGLPQDLKELIITISLEEGFYHYFQVNINFPKGLARNFLEENKSILVRVSSELMFDDIERLLRKIIIKDEEIQPFLEENRLNISYLFETRSMDDRKYSADEKAKMRQELVRRFNISELKIFCTDLSVDFDNLAGDTKEAKALELILFLERNRCLSDLARKLAPLQNPESLSRDAPPLETAQPDIKITDSVDVGIVIALKEEFEDLFPQIDSQSIFNDQINQWYYLFPRSKYNCVVTFMDDVGPDKAALVGDRMIADYKPTTIVNIGIAGSLDKDVLTGDVVVAKQSDNYLHNSKAVTDDSDLGYIFQLSGDPYKTSPKYVSHAANLDFALQSEAKKWRTLCEGKLEALLELPIQQELLQKNLIGPRARIHTGNIASGQTVGATERFTRWLKGRDRKYLALEMESVGVALAAHTRNNIETLIIRGISDYSDERKSELEKIRDGALRRYAMHNAIALLWAYMDASLI